MSNRLDNDSPKIANRIVLEAIYELLVKLASQTRPLPFLHIVIVKGQSELISRYLNCVKPMTLAITTRGSALNVQAKTQS